MGKLLNVGHERQIGRAKAKLHSLPVVPNGIPSVTVRSFREIERAVRTYKATLGDTPARVVSKLYGATIWIAYRCTEMSHQDIAWKLEVGHGAVHSVLRRVESQLRSGSGELNEIIDGILQVLVMAGAAALGAPDAEERQTDVARPGQPSTPLHPSFERILKLRRLKWSVHGIHKHTGIPLDTVAKVCGVDLNAGRI